MKRHIYLSSIILLALAFVTGCVDEMATDRNSGFDEGELTECRLGVAVAGYDVSSTTKAADPDEDADNSASDQEKAIDNIWVFQYDASGNILIKPRYYTTASKDGDVWLVLLKEGVASTVYVVANTSDPEWASSLDDFSTLALLKAQNLPSSDFIDPNETPEFYIPMQGSAETAGGLSDITVNVERMFAKLVISTKMVKVNVTSMSLKSILINNIPKTCRVESRSCDDSDSESEKEVAEYSDDFYVWSIEATNTTGTGTQDETTDGTTYLKQSDYVLYVPENIQGEEDADNVNKLTGKGVPDRALTVNYTYKVLIENDPNHPDKDVESGNTEGSIAVYPGDNTENNFNVKRNRIYKITATINTANYFAPSASANCFVVEPGEALVFWPYYRTETGGGYNIKTYLDPTVEDLAIASVKIIWQEKDVIGDDSDGSLVTCSDLTTDDVPEDSDEYEYLRDHFKIRVQASKTEGNALIGAYNSSGDIIWSWHIWVTDNDPANVGNAQMYTTYKWDRNGIKTDTRVEGYRIMPCNLGAKEFEPGAGHTNRISTFGPIYQWGRKDPFPTMQNRTGYKYSGFGYYNDSNNGDKTGNGSCIQVYDNSNQKITITGSGYVGAAGAGELFQTVLCTSTSSATDEYQQRTDGLKYAIQHPTTFIAATKKAFSTTSDYKDKDNYINDADWLLGHADNLWGGKSCDTSQEYFEIKNEYYYYWSGDDRNSIADIWPWMWDNYGDEKTIFDPSPKGWRVPPDDFWMGFTKTGESVCEMQCGSFNTFIDLVNSTDSADDINKNFGIYLYTSGWKTGEKTFFPCPGTRLASGQPFNLMICGNYHCASDAYLYDPATGSIINNGRVNCFHVHSYDGQAQVNPFECQRVYVGKAIAGPIRCVLDTR